MPLLFVAIAWPALRENSATYDETSYVPAGFTYLTRGDFRLNPEHPPLLKALFALPVLPLSPSIGAETERAFEAAPGDRNNAQWIFGYRFLYRDNQPEPLLWRARLVALLLTAGVVLLVFAWARELFGTGGALFAASLITLDPNFLAHGALATTDATSALFLCGTVYFARRSLRAVTIGNVIATGLAAGAAFVSKFTSSLLVPAMLILGAVRMFRADPWPVAGARAVCTRSGRAGALAALLLGWGLVCWASVWATYGFRYPASPGGRTLAIADAVRGIRRERLYGEAFARGAAVDARSLEEQVDATPPGLTEHLLALSARHRLLPEAYLYGLAFAAQRSQARNTFLLGRYSFSASRAYFPICFAVKTPAATLVALALALALAVPRALRLPSRGEAAFLLVPAAVIALAAVRSNLAIGHRHILGLYPFLYVYAGSLPGELKRRMGTSTGVWGPVALVLLLATETIAARPHFIPFFNVLAGGAKGGINLLSDSNLDWGQGLPALRRWMAERKVRKVNLSYFGTADPAAYGISFVPLAGSYRFDVPGAGAVGYPPQGPELPGYVAIGATNLQGVYFGPTLRKSYEFLRRKTPVAILAGSLYVYWVDRWGE